jgi:biotin operon repressor
MKDMIKVDVEALEIRIGTMLPMLNEYQRRMFLATEAKAIGYVGISLVSRISGISRQTVQEGVKELDNSGVEILTQGRCRRAGAGRKKLWETHPEILDVLADLLEAHTKGDPMRLLLWTNKSLRNLSSALKEKGYLANKDTVGQMLKMRGYGLQADKKTLTVKPSHPDRDAQFEHINNEAKKAIAAGNPVLSIDAKKKENIGNFKNNGRTYQPHKTPIEVLDHDFPIKELGKATPFGVYNIYKNQGFVNVGLSSDTAVFAVESIRKWWYTEGVIEYKHADKIILTADCGGSNGNRNRLWKFELQKLAREINKDIQVLHYPPGTSKWNKIEHRMFAFISKNWQGIPLESISVIVNLIGSTTTTKGLSIRCVIDEKIYEKGIEVTEDEFSSICIFNDAFHGDWNYTICRKLI